MPAVDPRIRVLFVAIVAIAAVATQRLSILGGLSAALAVAWLIAGLGLRRLGRQVFKLFGFAAVVFERPSRPALQAA